MDVEDTGVHQYSYGIPFSFKPQCDECVAEAWERMTYGGWNKDRDYGPYLAFSDPKHYAVSFR